MPDKEWLYPNLHENGYTYSVLENLHYTFRMFMAVSNASMCWTANFAPPSTKRTTR